MKLRIFFTLLLPYIVSNLVAQNDSITLAQALWQHDTLQDIVLHRVHFSHNDYFNSNQYIAFLEVPQKAEVRLKLGYEEMCAKTSTIAARHLAVAAVNGSFFEMEHHHPICYLRINGENVGENTPGKDTVNRKYYQYGTLVFNNKDVRILRTDSVRRWENTLPDSNIITAGPLLIYHGVDQPMRNDLSFVNRRHNRTAVGLKEDGTILLLVVDGRTKESAGLTLDELTSTMRWLGCRDALNLDGGGSTTLYIKGYPYQGVVNHPSDNGRFDHYGERKVSNILMIIKD